MKKLGARNYSLISRGVKAMGNYNPDEIFFMFEEELYTNEYKEIEAFLKWCHTNGKMFGSGNYEQVFREFKKETA